MNLSLSAVFRIRPLVWVGCGLPGNRNSGEIYPGVRVRALQSISSLDPGKHPGERRVAQCHLPRWRLAQLRAEKFVAPHQPPTQSVLSPPHRSGTAKTVLLTLGLLLPKVNETPQQIPAARRGRGSRKTTWLKFLTDPIADVLVSSRPLERSSDGSKRTENRRRVGGCA